MALALNIGKCTLLGNYRENNEDAVDVKQFPDMTACLVADGMGGQAAGEVASKRAIEIVPRELKKYISGVVSNDETKNIIRRAIVQANEEIMAMAALLQAGDRFLLCTDGLSGVVADEQILDFMKDKADVQECADGLGQLALDAGSRDNITCIVIEVVETV